MIQIVQRLAALTITLRRANSRDRRLGKIFSHIIGGGIDPLGDQLEHGKTAGPLLTQRPLTNRAFRQHFMDQTMKVRQPGLMCLDYEDIAEQSSALFPNTLEPQRDFRPDFADALGELLLRIEPVKVNALRRQTEARSGHSFEMSIGTQRQRPEPCATFGRLNLRLGAELPMPCASLEALDALPTPHVHFKDVRRAAIIDRRSPLVDLHNRSRFPHGRRAYMLAVNRP